MRQLLERMTLTQAMALAVGIALIAVEIPAGIYDVSAELDRIETLEHRRADAALDMLEAVHVQSMIHRGRTEDGDSAIETLNGSMEQFSDVSRGVDLWLVMGPKVLDYQIANGQEEVEGPLDDVDRAAIETARPQRTITEDDVLRVTRPVVMGRGHAGHARCAACHARIMDVREGEVIGAYSAAIDLQPALAAWRQGIVRQALTSIGVAILTLGLIFAMLQLAALRPLRRLIDATQELAHGNLKAEVVGGGRHGELGMLAYSLEIFRDNLLAKRQLERENAIKERRILEERAEAEKLEITLRGEEEKMYLQRQFVAMASHEFRTPLAIIDGQAKAIGKRIERLTSDGVKSKLRTIETSVGRLIDLMESMLSSSRLEAGTMNFAPKEHDLRALVGEVCAHQDEISKSHEVVADLDVLPQSHVGDPLQLRQMFTNLLSNAVKYSPGAARVDVTAVEEAGGYRIDVRDYGVGIPDDELAKLGTRFFRASTSKGIIGTGIGLNLVKAFADLHKGRLTIKSSIGEGTTFSVYLPRMIVRQAA